MRVFLQILLVLVFVAVGALGLAKLTANKPKVKKEKTEAVAPTVRVVRALSAPEPIVIIGRGSIGPVRQINLAPQVSGKVVYISPNLVNGGQFQKDEELIRIDSSDYQLAVNLASSGLKAAKARQNLARKAYNRSKSLLPRKVISTDKFETSEAAFQEAAANYNSSLTNLRKARLALSRTVIKAPFDGRVTGKNVDIGQYVVPGAAVAAIFSIEEAEVVIPLPDADLGWFHIPGFTPGQGPGARADVTADFAGQKLSRPAEVVRAQGSLDPMTRMMGVVVRIQKPYAQLPPLAIGLYVTVRIQGRALENATKIPRAALRADNIVWVVDQEGKLGFRKITPARRQDDEIVVGSGLTPGEKVVISPLKTATDGMAVKPVNSNNGAS